MKTRKGITPVIAIVLLILITVGAVGVVYTQFQSLVGNPTEQLREQEKVRNTKMSISGAYRGGGGINITLRNTGSTAINTSDFNVMYVPPNSDSPVSLGAIASNYPSLSPTWTTVINWNREDNGDTLSGFESQLSKDINTMSEWENNGDKIRWSQAGQSGDTMKYHKNVLFSNTGSARLDVKFQGISYEASGITFYAMDSSGATYAFVCEDDGETPDDGTGCGYSDGGTFTWDGTYTVNAPNRIIAIYVASDHNDCCYDGGDSSDLYRMIASVERAQAANCFSSADNHKLIEPGETYTCTTGVVMPAPNQKIGIVVRMRGADKSWSYTCDPLTSSSISC